MHSQFDSFVPHDSIAGQCEGFNVHDVYVAMVCSYVHPFCLEWQMAACHPTQITNQYTPL